MLQQVFCATAPQDLGEQIAVYFLLLTSLLLVLPSELIPSFPTSKETAICNLPENENICKNGGTCTSPEGEIQCLCIEGFTGPFCGQTGSPQQNIAVPIGVGVTVGVLVLLALLALLLFFLFKKKLPRRKAKPSLSSSTSQKLDIASHVLSFFSFLPPFVLLAQFFCPKSTNELKPMSSSPPQLSTGQTTMLNTNTSRLLFFRPLLSLSLYLYFLVFNIPYSPFTRNCSPWLSSAGVFFWSKNWAAVIQGWWGSDLHCHLPEHKSFRKMSLRESSC